MTSQDLTDAPDTYIDEKKIDAFISYRRINGAQLARFVLFILLAVSSILHNQHSMKLDKFFSYIKTLQRDKSKK